MRQTVLASLVLLPVLAHAQAKTSIERQPSNSSAVLLAELDRPAAPAAPVASLSAVALASHTAIRESVQTRMVDDLMASAIRHPGALEFALKGSAPTVGAGVEVVVVIRGQSRVRDAEQRASALLLDHELGRHAACERQHAALGAGVEAVVLGAPGTAAPLLDAGASPTRVQV